MLELFVKAAMGDRRQKIAAIVELRNIVANVPQEKRSSFWAKARKEAGVFYDAIIAVAASTGNIRLAL